MLDAAAFAAGDREGLIMERPFKKGETLREGTYLDIDAELRLVGDVKKELERQDGGDKTKRERKGMKELGLERSRHFGWSNTYVFTKAMGEMLLGQLHGAIPVVILRPSIITSILRDPLPGWMQGTRTIDTIIIGYAKQNLSCFLADLDLTMDVIPGDMVANAMMVAMVAHSEEQGAEVMYHATSSLRNPAPYGVLYESGRRHFYENPRLSKDGQVIPTKEMHFFKTIASFHLYMLIKYKLPLEVRLSFLFFSFLFSSLSKVINPRRKYVPLKKMFTNLRMNEILMVCADPAPGEPAPLRPLLAALRRPHPEIQVRHASRRRLRALRLIQRMVSVTNYC
uniref:Fatty acyl-CoA reductase n=1 Tax=Aegilops tauschii subsp. strangulata TaxID=200361 RepID=A0A453RSC2_AEGTS